MVHYVKIDTPAEVKSYRVKKEVEELLDSGVKTSEILLSLGFVCDRPESVFNQFRIIKNGIAFVIRENQNLYK